MVSLSLTVYIENINNVQSPEERAPGGGPGCFA